MNCKNCRRYRPMKARGLCRACYAYKYRTGRPRPAGVKQGPAPQLTSRQVRAMYQRYCQTRQDSRQIAAAYQIDPTTMYTYFRRYRLPLNRQHRLSDAQVRHIRRLGSAGATVEDIQRTYPNSASYIRAIVAGHVRREAGGPFTPKQPRKVTMQQCRYCKILTRRDICGFCRKEANEKPIPHPA